MKIIHCSEAKTEHLKKSTCRVYLLHLAIENVKEYAQIMIDVITSTSWVSKLSAVDKACYSARSERTVNKLSADIFNKIDNLVSTDFGEYMVSLSAQDALETSRGHKRIPLAELFKEKVLGNPGFDFHTESDESYLVFGESKYSGSTNPYNNALSQICDFIDLKKDIMELSDLRKFASAKAIRHALRGKKSYAAAFSINAQRPMEIINKAFDTEHAMKLLCQSELYLIGVEVYDQRDN